jgi:hypothetical protein
MDWQDSLNKYGLIPDDNSLPEIRKILAQETELERAGKERGDDLALICCVQLFSRGFLEDVLLIWETKSSGFDLRCYLDVELLCGAGLEKTKQFLSSQTSQEAVSALEWIINCEQSGQFED